MPHLGLSPRVAGKGAAMLRLFLAPKDEQLPVTLRCGVAGQGQPCHCGPVQWLLAVEGAGPGVQG